MHGSGVYITMTTFSHILRETDKLTKMIADFNSSALMQTEAQEYVATVAVPATESTQGEQKMPVAKPYGVTR